MDTYAGKMIFSFFGIVLIFFVVMADISFKLDQEHEANIQSYVQQFVDKSVVTGRITEKNMQEMYDLLYQTGYLYDIEVVHKTCYEYPEADGDYSTHYDAYSKESILENMNDGSYKMKDGDNLTVSVKTKSQTASETILGWIAGRGFMPIRYTYSKDVGNTYRT